MEPQGYDSATEFEKRMIALFDRHEYTQFLAKTCGAKDSWLLAYYRAVCYRNGWGCKRDVPLAQKLLRENFSKLKSEAEMGNVRAQNALGVLLRLSIIVFRKQPSTSLVYARYWFERAAKAGFPRAIVNLARCYRKGIGGERNIEKACRLYHAAEAQGVGQLGYDLAYLSAAIEHDSEKSFSYIKNALDRKESVALNFRKVLGADFTQERVFVELLIAIAKDQWREREETEVQCMFAPSPEFEASSDEGKRSYGDEWLLSSMPSGAALPPSAGQIKIKTPDLTRANLSFAAKLIIYVRDRFNNDAPRVYRAAHISRKTYSAIISNELRPVSRRTAMAFAFALRLSRSESEDFLRSAGFSLSLASLEDIIFGACIDAGIYDIDYVSRILIAHKEKPFQEQVE